MERLTSDGNPGLTSATLYLGLKRDPREMGFKGENYWILESLDHDSMLTGQDDLLNGKPRGCYLSFPSLKDNNLQHHTAEVIATLSYASVKEFREEPWRRRSDRNQDLKDTMSKGLLAFVEKHFPGFEEMVEFTELSTPLTVEHFTAHRGGAMYGIPGTPERNRAAWLKPVTPVQNLFLTGTDAGTLGIVGAMMGGVSAAARIIGPFGFFSIMAAVTRAAIVSSPRTA